MFTPTHLLPSYDNKDHNKYTKRWQEPLGLEIRQKILSMIRDGAGEDFLQWDFEKGNLPILESQWDLKGIDIHGEDIQFPETDSFEAIDFSFAEFFNSIFTRACFSSAYFSFSRIYGCEFKNCIFGYTNFYACKFENVKFINCDFIERNRMTTCDFQNVSFENCYYSERLFFDCRFDSNAVANDPISTANLMRKNYILEKSKYAEIVKGVQECYVAGEVTSQARNYLYKKRRYLTFYNTKKWSDKSVGLFLQLIAGYGVKPSRVLITMSLTFFVFSCIFMTRYGFSEGLLLSAGAFFTFGANTNHLQQDQLLYVLFYILESFLGISLMALLVTVLASYWFQER
jgi:uncharacterized protein YjbI with pentapeptide repeats